MIKKMPKEDKKEAGETSQKARPTPPSPDLSEEDRADIRNKLQAPLTVLEAFINGKRTPVAIWQKALDDLEEAIKKL
jgi:hypothetical protein